MKLIPVRVFNVRQALWMADIYNACLSSLDTPGTLQIVSDEEQTRWWRDLDHDRVQAYLYYEMNDPNTQPRAFSKVTIREGKFCTPLFAIRPSHHGKGYAREIIHHYLKIANRPLAGTALVGNKIIMRLNQEEGWQELKREFNQKGEEVAFLYHPGVNPDLRQQEIYDAILDYHHVPR